MAGFHTQIGLTGYDFQDSQITVKLASGITKDHVNRALTQDTSADNTMKLAGDGDPIEGYLYSVEDRAMEGQLVGVCSFRFAEKLPIKSGETVARGDRLVGAGSGEVKALAALGASPTNAQIMTWVKAYATAPIVWAVASGKAHATKIA